MHLRRWAPRVVLTESGVLARDAMDLRNISSPSRPVSDFDYLRDQRDVSIADGSCHLPTPFRREDDVCCLKSPIAIAARHFRAERGRNCIEPTSVNLELPRDTPAPAELHSERTVARHETSAARFEHDGSVWPQTEGSDRYPR